MNKNIYPNAFCNIADDPWDGEWVMTKHADGTGSKTVARALCAIVTDDFSVFCKDPFDAVSMNTGDISASGFVYPPYVITDTIGINAVTLPKHPILLQIVDGIHIAEKFIPALWSGSCVSGRGDGGFARSDPNNDSRCGHLRSYAQKRSG
ncbi:MAG: hypothetical protein KC736_00380 [Candidatus Moranbacteria bacterium]|nr:hypothetical protein [Candidatus Moranbacteria bacterium]